VIDAEETEVTSIFYWNHRFNEELSKPYLMVGSNTGVLKILDI
jgi:hypothetical protein